MSDPMMDTEAWQQGEAKAAAELAKQPADDQTVSVSLDHDKHGKHVPYDHVYFKICQVCHWDRNGDRCTCVRREDGSYGPADGGDNPDNV